MRAGDSGAARALKSLQSRATTGFFAQSGPTHHPGLIQTARAEFDAVLGNRPNQIHRLRDDVRVTEADLLDTRIDGEVTDAGVAANVSISLRYIESWLRGVGAAVIDNLMEDAATAEISRSQLWHWIHKGIVTAEGTAVTRDLIAGLLLDAVAEHSTPDARFDDAATILRALTLEDGFPTSLTIAAYSQYLVNGSPVRVTKARVA